jgi:CheY-like chemotaxis protein
LWEINMATVLVVDDEADVVDGLAATLAHRGLKVLTATSGQEALDLVEAEKPDAIVLDLSMPDIDGLGVLEQLRDWPDFADTPVFIYSAVADDDTVRQSARRLGAAEFLLKGSTSWEELADRVKAHLAGQASAPAAVG